MSIVYSSLTIIFEAPFYQAIFERRVGTSYEVAKVNMGTSEPKTTLIYSLIINHWHEIKFFRQDSPELEINTKRINPKRRQRLAKKAIKNDGLGTKAQIALQRQLEQFKLSKKTANQQQKARVAQEKFKLRQKKKLEKHKGH
ncbi:YjdF family protein [Lactobacillus sp. ESL0731]|uniref:YjdF family protein n=1 Tax=unclassified Lactobacillus TaxID=2620435 RepID=UPI0023F80FEA|nr:MULTISPECIES: YjdF family protein [unclassified Lactobacillus]WEV51840.1 YjdF family protein [Lactobacillus sp. ESL0700]WEV62970.1 YjdF family protein [Lactobacillus sp. ESL0731]